MWIAAIVWLSVWASDIPWIPPGPLAEQPLVGPGSDWDRRLHWGAVGRAAQKQGRIAWWDPFQKYGRPQFSEPENFLLHPAYAVGSRVGGVPGGLRGLLVFGLVALFGGLWALGNRVGVPPPLSIAVGLFLVCSPEWASRLSAGHLMFLGVCLWPGCLAAVLYALESGRSSRATLGWGAFAGCALGLTALTGGHYPLPYGLMAACLTTWAVGASPKLCAALVGLFAIPLLPLPAPAVGRFAVDAGVVAVLAFGVWSSALRGRQGRVLAGLGLGLVGTAATFLVPASRRGADLGRLQFGPGRPPGGLAVDMSRFGENFGGLEGVLELPSVGWWFLVALGVGLLARRSIPLAVVATCMALAAWTVGRPLQPWEVVASLPGMNATTYFGRLQWILPILAPLGLAAGLAELGERVGGARGRWGLGLVVAVLLVWALLPRYPLKQAPIALDPEYLPAEPGAVLRVAEHSDALVARAMFDGTVLPNWGSDLQRIPPDAGDRPWWVVQGDAVEVTAVLDRWDVRGTPGSVVRLAQRDLTGWRCSGGSLRGDVSPGPPDDLNWWWLTVEVGDAGHATCLWRPPLLALGAALQGSALLVLLLFLRPGLPRESADPPEASPGADSVER